MFCFIRKRKSMKIPIKTARCYDAAKGSRFEPAWIGKENRPTCRTTRSHWAARKKLQVSMARQVSEGQQTRTEMVYQYLTGPRFRQRVEAIVEAFSSMQEDLDKERKAIMKQWAKREEQIERVMGATVGMYGDLQGIAGKSLQEIEGLELHALEDRSAE